MSLVPKRLKVPAPEHFEFSVPHSLPTKKLEPTVLVIVEIHMRMAESAALRMLSNCALSRFSLQSGVLRVYGSFGRLFFRSISASSACSSDKHSTTFSVHIIIIFLVCKCSHYYYYYSFVWHVLSGFYSFYLYLLILYCLSLWRINLRITIMP